MEGDFFLEKAAVEKPAHKRHRTATHAKNPRIPNGLPL
jgi:hypothetical protein